MWVATALTGDGTFSSTTDTPDGRLRILSRCARPGKLEAETADDFNPATDILASVLRMLKGTSDFYRSLDRLRRITLIDLLPIDENRIHCYQDSHLIVDFQSETVRLDGQPVLLTNKEFALLAFLTHRAGELVSRAALLTQVWGYSIEVRTRTLDVHVRRLRRGLGRYGKLYIETIFGVGYRFQPRRVDEPVPTKMVSHALWLTTEPEEQLSAARY